MCRGSIVYVIVYVEVFSMIVGLWSKCIGMVCWMVVFVVYVSGVRGGSIWIVCFS